MGEIPVWCDLPEEVPATIDAMVTAGEISPEERGRCVFWALAIAFRVLTQCMVRPCVARGFIDPADNGLASMYPASDWSVCSGPSWISARLRSAKASPSPIDGCRSISAMPR
jgi:hypothetical protein